jgi:hypothetical protein
LKRRSGEIRVAAFVSTVVILSEAQRSRSRNAAEEVGEAGLSISRQILAKRSQEFEIPRLRSE